MTDLPQGHIRHEGQVYVALPMFLAACAHVREQGGYANGLIATLNAVGQERRELRESVDRIRQERDEARVELEECRRKQVAMRKAVYNAAEGL